MTNFYTPIWPIDAIELRTLRQGEHFICLYSGGKDSSLALLKAMEVGHPVALVQCVTSCSHHSYYHHQPTEVAEEQARAFGIPLHISRATPWENPAQLIALYHSFVGQGVHSVVFGDLRLERNARWQAALCEQAGLTPRMPLWQLDPEVIVQEMCSRRMQSIITWVNPQKLPRYWIGKVYDDVAYHAFKQAGIDPLGENGEFHTTLVNCDRFGHSIDLDSIQ